MSAVVAGLATCVLVIIVAYALWRFAGPPSSSGPTDGRSPLRTHHTGEEREVFADFDTEHGHRRKL